MSKYDPLRRFLETAVSERLPMTFEEVEKQLGFRLPKSARRHQAWWANTGGSHVHATAWLRAGRRTAELDLENNTVVFVRVKGLKDTGVVSVKEPGRPFQRQELVIDPAKLSGLAAKLLEEYLADAGGEASAAISRALEEAALARRRALLAQLRLLSPKVSDNSADLIREDRDAR